MRASLCDEGSNSLWGILKRQLVDIVTDLLVRLDAEGKIVKRTKKIYTMILFGIINFTYTWYDPKGAVGPQEFAADMAVELFLQGFAPGEATKSQTCEGLDRAADRQQLLCYGQRSQL
jgi:hypothetical protein